MGMDVQPLFFRSNGLKVTAKQFKFWHFFSSNICATLNFTKFLLSIYDNLTLSFRSLKYLQKNMTCKHCMSLPLCWLSPSSFHFDRNNFIVCISNNTNFECAFLPYIFKVWMWSIIASFHDIQWTQYIIDPAIQSFCYKFQTF